MKKRRMIIRGSLPSLFLFLVTLVSCGPDYSKFHNTPSYKPGEILITLKDKGSQSIRNGSSALDRLTHQIDREALPIRFAKDLWKRPTKNGVRILKLVMPEEGNLFQMIEKLQQMPGVLSAEPNYYNQFFTKYNLKRMDRTSLELIKNANTNPSEGTPAGTTPSGTTPSGTTPAGTTPSNDSSNDYNFDPEAEIKTQNIDAQRAAFYSACPFPTNDSKYKKEQFFDFKAMGVPQTWGIIYNKGTRVPLVGECKDYKQELPEGEESYYAAPVSVAVLDSGIYLKHEDLQDSFAFSGGGEYDPAKDIEEQPDDQDNDANGYFDDFAGANMHDPFGLPNDELPCEVAPNPESCLRVIGHGTHVAGIIGATHGNKKGISGVCPTCKLVAVKVVDEKGSIPDSYVIEGLNYAFFYLPGAPNPPVNLLNFSFGKFVKSKAQYNAVEDLSREQILIVAAAGNEDTERPSYPAAIPATVAVSAIGGIGTKTKSYKDANGNPDLSYYYQKAGFSNFGLHVDVSAPGVDIYSTCPEEIPGIENFPEKIPPNTVLKYCHKSGTSQATPMTVGAIGLFWSIYRMSNTDPFPPEALKNHTRVFSDRAIFEPFGYNHMYQVAEGARGNQVTPGNQYLGAGMANSFFMVHEIRYGFDTAKNADPLFGDNFFGCSLQARSRHGKSGFIFLLILTLGVFFIGRQGFKS